MSYCSNLNLYQIVLECCFCFEVEQTRISTTYLVTLVAENCFATNVLASLSLSLSLFGRIYGFRWVFRIITVLRQAR